MNFFNFHTHWRFKLFQNIFKHYTNDKYNNSDPIDSGSLHSSVAEHLSRKQGVVSSILAGGAAQPSANFDYAGPLTESVLLGCLASIFPGEELKWDSAALKFNNSEAATRLVKRTYRPGWEIA